MTALPESEGSVRAWLRATSPITALVDSRTYFAMPTQDRPQTPFIVFYRTSGTPDQHWTDHPDITIECWGENKNEASNLAKVVAQELLSLDEGSHIVIDGVRYAGASINRGPVPMSGTSKAKRYIVEATFHMRLV